jgi:ElaB/YqjD/DUF883 family membrane-anchored ribosome-binding protein
VDPKIIADNQEGTKNNIEKAKEEFALLTDSLEQILQAY